MPHSSINKKNQMKNYVIFACELQIDRAAKSSGKRASFIKMNGEGVSARVPAPGIAPRGEKRSDYAAKRFVAAILPLLTLAFTTAGFLVKSGRVGRSRVGIE